MLAALQQCRPCSGLGLARARQVSCGVLHLHAQESPGAVQRLNAGSSKATGPGWEQPQGLGAGQHQAQGLQGPSMSPQGQGQQLSLSPTTEQQQDVTSDCGAWLQVQVQLPMGTRAFLVQVAPSKAGEQLISKSTTQAPLSCCGRNTQHSRVTEFTDNHHQD